MKRSNTVLTAALALGLVTLIGFAGNAEARGHGPNPGAHYAALSTEQQADLDKIFTAHQTAAAPLFQQLQAKRAELNLLQYQPNPQRAQALFQEIADIEYKLYSARIELDKELTAKGFGAFSMGSGMRHMGGGPGMHMRGSYGPNPGPGGEQNRPIMHHNGRW